MLSHLRLPGLVTTRSRSESSRGVGFPVVGYRPVWDYDKSILQRCFPNLVSSFKEHFVVDLNRPYETLANSHHRRNARKALSKVTVEDALILQVCFPIGSIFTVT